MRILPKIQDKNLTRVENSNFQQVSKLAINDLTSRYFIGVDIGKLFKVEHKTNKN